MNDRQVEVYQPGAVQAPPPALLFGTDNPATIVTRARAIAQPLAAIIEDRRLYTEISGRRHVRVEGWTLLGSMLGVFPVTAWTRPLPDQQGWEARVEARTLAGAIVGAAEAQCTREEANWRERDDFALRSMAQTRATSKALRLPLGFVMSLAGYQETPAEEMDAVEAAYRPMDEGAPRSRSASSRPSQGERAPLTATEPQIKAIYAYGRSACGLSEEETEAHCVELFGVRPSGLNRRQASEFIDALKQGRGQPVEAPA